ncbi:E3 ubiquitin/ISG15 ligase TRIM25 [Nelusetta ayraudi]|uniref:E3 ubiquitin/ISG15 ligase TRIM25 n=1 Tax=Nelusetta ayraudi TaxID=303726 RepID=UPI003F6FD9F8
MASKLWTEEQFNCPVCLELPSDPVTIPCGHSYCMACIKDYWSKDDGKGMYSCPQCRQTFYPKPPLSRNTMLAEAVEQLRQGARKSDVRESMRLASTKARLSTAAVACDMCKGERREAIRSCLSCMASFCEAHLKPHKTKKELKKHELIPPTGNLAEKICVQHKYLQEFFCRQCRIFVCWLCTSNQHKGHECVSTKVERSEREKVLSELQAENLRKLKDREQELKELKKAMEVMKHSADRVQQDGGKVLQELQRSMERLQELVEEQMEQANVEKMGQAEEVADSLEAEIRALRKRDGEMKDLARCEDHIHYLQTCESLNAPLETGDLPAVVVHQEASFLPVQQVILDLRDQVEELCNQELSKIIKQVNDTSIFAFEDPNRNAGLRGGIRKLFSGLAPRQAATRSPAPSITSTASVGSRVGDRRGIGASHNGPDVRSRDAPRATPILAGDRRPTSSPNLGSMLRRDNSERSLWSRSSQLSMSPTPAPAPDPAPAPVPAPAPAPVASPAPAAPALSGGFSRLGSISSLSSLSSIFRSHRRGTTPATPVQSDTPPAGGNPWAMTSLPETPTEINPGLFLDTPAPDAMTQPPVFPALREINIDSIQAPEPRTREEFLQYAIALTLDPDTAHRRLALTEGNTKATLQVAAQPLPDSPRRFDGWTQVMCSAPLHGQRCYWEVEWRGRGSSLGVAYGALKRKGTEARSGLGYNAQSWTLELSDACCSAMHDNQKKDIAVTYSPRLGVYLDSSVGTLTFYSVAETMTHLHTFRTNFTQPLYAAFGVGSGVGVGLDFALGQFSSSSDSVKICPM